LEDILRMHGPPIVALLKLKLGGWFNSDEFEDVLAEALFRVWQQRARYDALKSSLRVWLFRIAENFARDVLKHGWHRARCLELAFEPEHLALLEDRQVVPDVADSEPTLSVPIDVLRELLAILPEAQRRIVQADADSPEGLLPSQVLADELGIPASTVRVYRRRALERLRRELTERGLQPK